MPATGPNSGQLLTVGSLGVDTNVAGFDISNATQVAYASLQIHQGSALPAGYGLFSINLDTGAATRLGGLPTTAQPIVSIAVAPGSTATAGHYYRELSRANKEGTKSFRFRALFAYPVFLLVPVVL